jgi:transcriptional regulator with XRE-family HTH domain
MDTERILAVRVGKALRRLREAARLWPAELSRRSLVHRTQISRYEAGELCPPLEVLQVILNELNKVLNSDVTSDITIFLARLGLTLEEYDTFRSRKYLHHEMLTGLQEARTVKEINGWLVDEVVKRRRGKRQSLPDLNLLDTNLSRQLTNARDAALTYPGHPLLLKPNIHPPRDGFQLRWEHPFLQSLTQGYFGEGPRLTGVKAVTQKLWPIDLYEKLVQPIIARGDEKALLAASILKKYEQTDNAFHEQMKKKQWQYLDIVLLSAIRELVTTGKPSPDSSLKYLGIKALCPEMVRHLLFYVMGLLPAYENTYHLALLDDVSDPTDGAVQLLAQHLTAHFWTVMPGADGQLSLIVTEWPVDEQGKQQEVHRHIADMNIIKPFMEPFCELWRKMPPRKLVTDKDAVIKHIVAELENLPTTYPT